MPKQSWKEHTCVHCAAVFSYRMKRRASEDEPLHACPTCGLVPADLVGAWRHAWQNSLLLVTTAFFVGVGLCLVFFNFPYFRIAEVAAFVAYLFLIAQIGLVIYDPNADVEANRQQALEQVEAGTMRFTRTTDTPVPPVEPRSFGERWRIPIIAGIATLAVSSSLILRLSFNWPINRGLFPEVVGPGDTFTLYYKDKLRNTIEGHWSGRATAQAVNAAELGLGTPWLDAGTHNEQWGHYVSAPRHGRSIEVRPWVEVLVPHDPVLARKTLEVRTEIAASYPAFMGRLHFEVRSVVVSQETTLALATPGAGRIYKIAWWGGVMGGSVANMFICLGAAVAAMGLKRKAPPGKILSGAEGSKKVDRSEKLESKG
jgi:hypothetical protein